MWRLVLAAAAVLPATRGDLAAVDVFVHGESTVSGPEPFNSRSDDPTPARTPRRPTSPLPA